MPAVLPLEQYPPNEIIAYRLWGHYRNFDKGRTVILKTDNTCVVVDYPIDETGSQLSGGTPNRAGANWDVVSIGGVPVADIRRVFMGGHFHTVTAAEQALIEACGAGGTFTP